MKLGEQTVFIQDHGNGFMLVAYGKLPYAVMCRLKNDPDFARKITGVLHGFHFRLKSKIKKANRVLKSTACRRLLL